MSSPKFVKSSAKNKALFFNTTTLLSLTLAATMVNAGDKEIVDYRKNNMEIIGGHMGSMVAIIKGEVPYGDDLAFHANGLAAAAPKVLPAFKAEAMTAKSEALPDIWDDWAAYEKAALKLETTSKALATAVASGDQGAIGAALGDVGKSCKGCHDNFTKEH